MMVMGKWTSENNLDGEYGKNCSTHLFHSNNLFRIKTMCLFSKIETMSYWGFSSFKNFDPRAKEYR